VAKAPKCKRPEGNHHHGLKNLPHQFLTLCDGPSEDAA
jgi:hypothetical protein